MKMVSRTKEEPGREPLRLRAADAARWYVRRVLSSKREQADAVSFQDRRQASCPFESAPPTCKASSATSSIADTGRKFVSGLPLSSGMSSEQSLGGIAPKGRGGLQTIIRAPMLPRHMRRAEPSLKRVLLSQRTRRWPSSSFLRADGSKGRELLMMLKKPCRTTANLCTRSVVAGLGRRPLASRKRHRERARAQERERTREREGEQETVPAIFPPRTFLALPPRPAPRCTASHGRSSRTRRWQPRRAASSLGPGHRGARAGRSVAPAAPAGTAPRERGSSPVGAVSGPRRASRFGVPRQRQAWWYKSRLFVRREVIGRRNPA